MKLLHLLAYSVALSVTANLHADTLDEKISEMTAALKQLQELKTVREERAAADAKAAEAKRKEEELERKLNATSSSKMPNATQPKEVRRSGNLGTVSYKKTMYSKGWYDDPFSTRKGQERYSDGFYWTAWISHVDSKTGETITDFDSSFGEPKQIGSLPHSLPENAKRDSWRWPKHYGSEEGFFRGDWAIDWKFGEIGTRFIYDSDGNNGNFDAFDDSTLGVSLDFLTIYGRKKAGILDLEWGPQAGFGIASASGMSGQSTIAMFDYGVFIRPTDRNINWQLEWGVLHAISGNDNLGFSERNDTALYFGLSLGSLIDTAKNDIQDAE